MAQTELAQPTSCVWFWEPSLGRQPGGAQEQVWEAERGAGSGWSSLLSGSHHAQPRHSNLGQKMMQPGANGKGRWARQAPPLQGLSPAPSTAMANQHPRGGASGMGALPRADGGGQSPRPQPPPDPSNGEGLPCVRGEGERGVRDSAGRGHCWGLLGGRRSGRSEPEGLGEGGMEPRSLSRLGEGRACLQGCRLRPALPGSDNSPVSLEGPRGSLPTASSCIKPPPPMKPRGVMCGKARRDAQSRPWP